MVAYMALWALFWFLLALFSGLLALLQGWTATGRAILGALFLTVAALMLWAWWPTRAEGE